MSRLTYKNPDGTWGMNNGYDMHKVPSELYGALWKLKDYEETGLDPERVEEINDFFNSQTAKILAELQEYKNLGLTLEQLKEIDRLYLEKCKEVNVLAAELEELRKKYSTNTNVGSSDWIPVTDRLPEESLYSVLGWDAYRERCCFVQYIGGRFVLGDDTESVDIKAWRPLPEPYGEE